MKTLFAFLLSCVCASAAYNTITIVHTNIPATGDTITRGASTAIWTNGPLNSTSWIQTNGLSGSATNLTRFLAANHPAYYVRQSNSTNVLVSGADLTISITGTWGYLVTNSLAATNQWLVTLPFDQQFETNRTNTADELIYGLNAYARTGAFSAGAQALTNFFNRSTSQRGGNKHLTNTVVDGGGITNSYATNIPYAQVTNLWAQVATIYQLANTLSNAVFWGAKLTNATGHFTNTVTINPSLGGTVYATNLVSWNNLYIGDTNTGIFNAWAIQTGTNNNGNQFFQVYNDELLGSVLHFLWDGGAAALTLTANTTNTGVFQSDGEITSSSVRAPLVTSTTMLTSTNQFNAGTNTSYATAVHVPKAVTTFTDGYNGNGDFRGGGEWVKISGPANAYTNTGWMASTNGARFLLQFSNPALSMAILNDSGLANSTNRIYTGAGGNVLHSTNNPVYVDTIYDTDHWRVISFR
jgi:hypothetical protein